MVAVCPFGDRYPYGLNLDPTGLRRGAVRWTDIGDRVTRVAGGWQHVEHGAAALIGLQMSRWSDLICLTWPRQGSRHARKPVGSGPVSAVGAGRAGAADRDPPAPAGINRTSGAILAGGTRHVWAISLAGPGFESLAVHIL